MPDTTDIQESADKRSPLLETVRNALGADGRWKLVRVSLPATDGGDRLLIWVTCRPPRKEARTLVQGGVYDLVTDLMPGASLLDIEAET